MPVNICCQHYFPSRRILRYYSTEKMPHSRSTLGCGRPIKHFSNTSAALFAAPGHGGRVLVTSTSQNPPICVRAWSVEKPNVSCCSVFRDRVGFRYGGTSCGRGRVRDQG